jgi:DNA-binding NarL/FixJ family response regulator
VSAIRLLLADDNPEVLETLIDLLQPAYDIAGAFSDGASVLQHIAALQPDLVILDISLGDMTGFEVARRLKKSGCPAKVIFLTVHENIDFIRAAFDLDAFGYVFKSRISSDLVDAINRACEGGHFSSAELPLAQ